MQPGFIVHVATPADWKRGADTPHYAATHFATEGFHHACTPAQVAGVLGRHFSGQRLLLLLVVDPARLASPLRWESAHGQDYPHVYGSIEREAVSDVIPIEADSLGRFVLPAWASAAAQVERMGIIRVGNVTISAVSDGVYHFDPHEFFPALSDEDWGSEPGSLGPAGTVDLNIGSFVVRSGGHTILVDTGLGPHGTSPRAESGLLPEALAASAGLREEIDLVVATHVHPDHVGWNMTGTGVQAAPTFPNARYLAPRLDYETGARLPEAEQSKPFREQVAPLERLGRLGLLDGGDRLTPEVWVEASPGHTAGHLCIHVASAGERAVIVGDLTHIPAQTHRTGWGSRADSNPAQARTSREAVLDAAEAAGMVYAAGHFPAPGFGRLVRLEGRRVWQALG